MPDRFYMHKLFRAVLSVIFPNRCPFCGKVIGGQDYYCTLCYENLPFVRSKVTPPEGLSEMLACCYYSRRARDAVLMLKFGGLIYPAETFGYMMSAKITAAGWDKTSDCIIPVPSGRDSIKKRGFCTALVIAKNISIRTNIPISCDIAAVKNKIEQKQLSGKGRRENAKKSFYLAKGHDVRGKHIIIVDDVSTTGSTLSAIADILLHAGAAEVRAVVFAQTVSFSSDNSNTRRLSAGSVFKFRKK